MVACSRWRTHPTHGLTHAVLAWAKGGAKVVYYVLEPNIGNFELIYHSAIYRREKARNELQRGGFRHTVFFLFLFLFLKAV